MAVSADTLFREGSHWRIPGTRVCLTTQRKLERSALDHVKLGIMLGRETGVPVDVFERAESPPPELRLVR